MKAALAVIGIALAALFVVAVLVACWEQVRGRRRDRPGGAGEAASGTPVDVHLDHLDACGDMPGGGAPETEARRTALGNAMMRMSKGMAPPSRMTLWLDTQPIVTAGSPPAARVAEKTERRKREFLPSRH